MKSINKDALRLAALTAQSASLELINHAASSKLAELGLSVDQFQPFEPLKTGEPSSTNLAERGIHAWINSVEPVSTKDTPDVRKAKNDHIKTLGKLVATLKSRLG